MKIKKTTALSLAVAFIMVTCTVTAFATSGVTPDSNMAATENSAFINGLEKQQKENRKKAMSVYEPFGLLYDEKTDELFFQNEKVRDFYDEHAGVGQSMTDGVVDLYAVYENDKLVGIKKLSQEEFDKKTLEKEALEKQVNKKREELGISDGADFSYEETEAAHTTNNVNADIYSQYEASGLTVDKETGKLYYDQKLVRCFDDQIPAANFSAKGIGYYEENGVIDVRVVRKNEGSTSVLVGLEVLSSDEFENRVIYDPTESDSADDNNLFSEYEKYGLSYDDGKKVLFYNGKQVRLFLDISNSNGKNENTEEFLGNTISNWDKNGTIDVYAVRSYDKDENGYGKLTGLRVASSEEFKENSSNFGKTNSTTFETAD